MSILCITAPYLTGRLFGHRSRSARASALKDMQEQLQTSRPGIEALLAADYPMMLLQQLGSVDFEDRKRGIRAFDALIQQSVVLGIESLLASYFQERGTLISTLVLQASQDPELAMHLGSVLRACSRSPLVVTGLLEQGLAEDLMELAACDSFEAGSYAFAALRDVFEEASESCARYVLVNFQPFFRKYDCLLRSKDYATCRQALAFLGTVFRSEEFAEVLAAYVAEPVFLQTHMNLLRSDSSTIRLQAFHVFKHFAVRREKAAKVQNILYRNKPRLLNFLVSYSCEKSQDAELQVELGDVVRSIHALVPAPASPRTCKRDATADVTNANTFLPMSSR